MVTTDWLSASICAAAIERGLKPGQALFHTGTRSRGFYDVVSGTVRLVRVDQSGRETVLQVAAAGDCLAEASLFSSTYHCDAIATTESVVRLYPKAIVLAEMQRDPKVAESFAAMLAHQVMTLRTRLERRNIHSARDRVRHFLTLNVSADHRTVHLSGSLKELAAELGLTHEALYRTLARMETEGEIERTSSVITMKRMT